MEPKLIATIVVIALILLWLVFLAADAYFGLFVFAPYEPPPLENGFQPSRRPV